MTSINRTPRIATLVNKQAPYRGRWIISQSPDLAYDASHEVEQNHGSVKVVEQLSLRSLADAQQFTAYLSSYGWSRLWEI